jgi:hypothetical protein
MYLQCPKCEKPNENPHISTPGIPEDHNEHPCRNPSCGQLLMWDYPQVYDAPYVPVSEPRSATMLSSRSWGRWFQR